MAEHIPAYMQSKGLDAIDDRMVIEATYGEGAEGIVTPGSFQVVSGGGTTNMSVSVRAGRGIVASDVAFGGSYHVVSDATKALDLGGSSGSQYRLDAIVARVRDSSLVAADGDSSFNIEPIAGAYSNSSTPPLPTLPDRSFLIAEVQINPGASTPSKITSRRRMARPRVWEAQFTKYNNAYANADRDDWTAVSWVDFGSMDLAIPAWVYSGGARMELEISLQGNAIAASEVEFRAALGNAPNDIKTAGLPHLYRVYSPGTSNFVARHESTFAPSFANFFTHLQVRRVQTRLTAVTFESVGIATHKVRFVDSPSSNRAT